MRALNKKLKLQSKMILKANKKLKRRGIKKPCKRPPERMRMRKLSNSAVWLKRLWVPLLQQFLTPQPKDKTMRSTAWPQRWSWTSMEIKLSNHKKLDSQLVRTILSLLTKRDHPSKWFKFLSQFQSLLSSTRRRKKSQRPLLPFRLNNLWREQMTSMMAKRPNLLK